MSSRQPPQSPQPPSDPNAPGLQYPQVTSQDQQYKDIIRNIYDNLFYIRRSAATPKPLTAAQLNALKNQLISQIINSVTNNINITSTGIFITGTHNNRITVYGGATQAVGTGFFETDRNVIYIITSGPKKWEFAAGVMIDVIANQPTDLGIYDASFLFFASDEESLYIWDGTQWILVSTDVAAAGYWAPVTNGVPDNPELIFDTLGNCVVSFTPTP